jgi:hypothetical protein
LIRDPADPGLKLGRVEKKQRKEKLGVTRLIREVDPARPDQKPGCNPLTFFYQKDIFFIFLKKELTWTIR